MRTPATNAPILDMQLTPADPVAPAIPATATGSDWSMPPIGDFADPAWRDAFFATQLANVVALHIYGKPLADLKPVLRADVRSFADGFTEDAIQRYAGILDAVERMHR